MTYQDSTQLNDFHKDTQSFFAGKSVLVTGGSGFIGSHLVEQLLVLKSKPAILTRQKSPKFLSHLGSQVKVINGDLNDYASTLAAVGTHEVVLNLAASVAGIEYNKNHPATIFQENLQGFFNIMKASKEAKVSRFLVTSSACVYPRHCSIPTPETEGFMDEPEPTNSGYGWSKRMEEYLGQKYAEEYGLSLSIGRPYNAYGPRDNFDPKSSHVIPALILKAIEARDGEFSVWGDGTHSRSFLYVEDFARGLIEVAARYPKADPLNIGADEEISIGELAHMIAHLVGQKTGRKIKPVFNPSGITGQPRRKCDVTKINSTLGYETNVSFEIGLNKTIDWYLNEYK
ncbi:MAG: NAD-dependent epimerase/dehydratase family protein [Bdellovibrionaceae bacterium]|nr:NAD-dependent epimerase/dehydratase family protein [Pseudobdellovibrionaceae bacterium]